MKTGLNLLFSILFCVLLSAPCSAYYIIELKTGGNIITQQYWEENGQIKFYHHGGLVGIAADMVLNIRDADASEFERLADIAKDTDIHSETPNQPDTVPGVNEKKGFEDEVAMYQAELLRINTDVVMNAERYKVAKQQNNRESMREAMVHLSNLRESRRELHQKVVNLYDGQIPEWWTH